MDDIVRYAPFGEVRGGALPTNITDRGFTGHKHNAEIGLIYMNARFYDPYISRFLSADTIVPDPMNPQAFNRFSYAYNNPIKYSDPSGHLSEDEIAEYFGYKGDSLEELMQQMIDDGLHPDYVGWLLDSDTAWGDVTTIYSDDGQRLGEAMLVLFETARYSGTFRGGLYGLNDTFEGREVLAHGIGSLNDHTLEAIELQKYYNEQGFQNLPSLGNDSLIPGTYYQRNFASDAGAVATIVGVTIVGAACVTSVVGIPACLGASAVAQVGAGATLVGGTWAYSSFTQPATQPIPIILRPDIGPGGHIYRVPGEWLWGYKPPQGF